MMESIQDLARRVNEMATAYRQSQVLFAGLDTGIFEILEEPRTAESIAGQLQWDLRGTRIFLDALLAYGLLVKTDMGYRNAGMTSCCLVERGPAYQGNIARHARASYDTWTGVAQAARTGKSVRGPAPQRTPEELRHFILGMADIARFSAKQILDLVDLSPYRHVLDVGGGPGTYGIAFLEQHPGMRATLMDRPDVVEIAKEQVAKAGLEERFDYIPGDFSADAMGTGYDLILISNIIHSYGPEMNRALVGAAFDALDPGGLLIVKDFLVDNDRSGPPFSLVFALHMLLHCGEGDAYAIDEVAGWAQDGGFINGRLVEMRPPSRMWLAEKPK